MATTTITTNNSETVAAVVLPQQKKITKHPSISASSTDEDVEPGDSLINEEIKKLPKTMKQHKTKKAHQSRIRPVSISDMYANNSNNNNEYNSNLDEPVINHKVTMRAKSVESTEFSPLKLPQQQQQQSNTNGNDLGKLKKLLTIKFSRENLKSSQKNFFFINGIFLNNRAFF